MSMNLDKISSPSRRGFLAGGSLIIGVALIPGGRIFAAAMANAAPLAPNAFIKVSPDDSVTIIIKHLEMGQGVTTGLATLVVEEMDADWAQVKTEYAPANAALYKNNLLGSQGTGGSTSMANSYDQMRKAGAIARALLIAAAAKDWNVKPDEIKIDEGVVSHASGKKSKFGALVATASTLPVPADAPLKTPADFKIIGKAVKRLDTPGKTNGTALYTIDVKLPGLLTAVTQHPPSFGAKVASFSADAAKAVKGVRYVVQIPEGVAVVADSMYAALKGREALKVTWDETQAEKRSSADLVADYSAQLNTPGLSFKKDGDAAGTLARKTGAIEADYVFPYLAHAPMEPTNCVAWLHEGKLETWAGHQLQTIDLANAAKAAGLPPEKVSLNSLISGGSFGRRANPPSDFVVEAVNIAKAIKDPLPVRLQRTREDDMRAGFYRPLFVHRVKTLLGSSGMIEAWTHGLAGQSIMEGTSFASKDGIDDSSVEGVKDFPYAAPNFAGELHTTKVGVPVLWWRSVGHTHTAFAVETMMDELAEAAKQDPIAFRLAHLKTQPRHTAVLKLLAQKADWGSKPAAGIGRGVALHKSFNTVVGEVVELRLTKDGGVKVERVVVAVDCGRAVNPDIVRAQMEGGVGFALSAALTGEITLDKGEVQQANFDTYEVLRIDAMPKVEVYIVPSDAAPTGVGEPGVPPLAPALANAVAQLTKTRIRTLPFSKTKLKAI